MNKETEDIEYCKNWVKTNNLPFKVVENDFNCFFCELQLSCAIGIDKIVLGKMKTEKGNEYNFTHKRQYYENFNGKTLEPKSYCLEQKKGFSNLQDMLSDLLKKPGFDCY